MSAAAIRSFRVFGNLVQKAGPYLLLELLMPGGTLFALALFLHQRRQKHGTGHAPSPGALLAQIIGGLRARIAPVWQACDIASLWRGRHRERDGLEALAMLPAPARTR